MSKKLTGWKTRGMNRDLSVSAFNPEFAFENRNLRLSTNENNTLMSWVNERGTQELSVSITSYAEGEDTLTSIPGKVIGTAVLNHKLVLFTHANEDRIIVLEYSKGSTLRGTQLFKGNLGFNTDYPIETIVSYETETVQKVYWTDNLNQPRVINIAAPKESIEKWKDTSFDFARTLKLEETVRVKKILGASGMFPAGVLQYAFTYYDKYGQESSIFYTTPLLYTSHKDRGGSPEDKVDNAFQITVSGVDENFDYLRIYSIMRTSTNGTPICRRVQDIAISSMLKNTQQQLIATYLDTGTIGDTIDPMELLYKGGEQVVCKTLEQKDNTLFLGNIDITRDPLDADLRTRIKNSMNASINTDHRTIYPTVVSEGSYAYANQLSSYNEDGSYSTPCGGFKKGEHYRLGIQFQHKTGKWSDPIFLEDYPMTKGPTLIPNTQNVVLPIFTGTLSQGFVGTLYDAGYRKARGVVVFPSMQDRRVLCQGVVNPTLFTANRRGSTLDGRTSAQTQGDDDTYVSADLYAQSSWFFRAWNGESDSSTTILPGGIVTPKGSGRLLYTKYDTNITSYNPTYIRGVEIQGLYKDTNKFSIDHYFSTLHSPDVEFDDNLWNTDLTGVTYQQVGNVCFTHTLSDIDIQTETPTISSKGSGFTHVSFNSNGNKGIVSGFLYDDFIVDEAPKEDDDSPSKYRAFPQQKSPMKWLVYLWNSTGSLNNDVPRISGTRTAVLKKKIVSNLRYATTNYENSAVQITGLKPQLFSSDQDTIIKVDDKIYQGNVDTMLVPDYLEGKYFVFENSVNDDITAENINTSISSNNYWRTRTYSHNNEYKGRIDHYRNSAWNLATSLVGDDVAGLAAKKDPVRMKYKSTPHIVFSTNTAIRSTNDACLPIAELRRDSVPMAFGGESPDAQQANLWIPCGEPAPLIKTDDCPIRWEYGDTYFQRWDCLKTYAFTREDINQVVEIGSFMLETHVNIDGRYDRNRGQSNNLNMSPVNFNLLNPVYSQTDNFFTYRIMDESFYKNQSFPNQLTWTLTKQAGADVDAWTTLTLANTIDMDGDKGKVNKLIRLNDSLLSFQDTGISQILYNENVQVSSTQGVPIEIANSGKVQGKRYLSNTVGCSNKWSMVSTPMGIYFMDSNEKSIYLFNGQLNNLSSSLGFNTWAKKNIPGSKSEWTPEGFNDFVGYYDKKNQDILFINKYEALAYSEKLGAFTSFYDYGGAQYLSNLGDDSLWLKYGANNETKLWRHQNGDYCKFFGVNHSYGTILIGNPEPQTDKIFTNLEFRACVDGEGAAVTQQQTTYEPYLPFDYLETWNEYQRGVAYLSNRNGHSAMLHHTADNQASLKRKFRIWRCDIPRANLRNLSVFDYTFDETFHNNLIASTNRMRNPWLYLKLRKAAAEEGKSLPRTEIHDLVMTYFN